MTRILYWNIEKFSAAKINVAHPVLGELNQSRLELIRQMIAPQHFAAGGWESPPPDIFIVAELSAPKMFGIAQGAVLNPALPGGTGARQLLEWLKEEFGAQWSIVPPLMLGEAGFREGVAVFYDSTQVRFAGPWVYAESPIGPVGSRAIPENLANLAEYPAAWVEAMPAEPEEWEFGEFMVPETQCAGRWAYTNAEGAAINFPGGENRPPFHTLFRDLTGGERWLDLFTVHTSPGTAVAATENLAQIPQIQPPAGHVSVVLGDFNVDTFIEPAVYLPLLEAGFAFLLNPREPGAGVEAEVIQARKPYCMTHLLRTIDSTPWNTEGVMVPGPQNNVYPRFGYMGATAPGGLLSEKGAIDNALVKHGEGAAAAAVAHVVNSVVGTPYNAAPAPEGVTEELTNGPEYESEMVNPIPLPEGLPEPEEIPGGMAMWGNFNRIRRTSDHLPVMIQV